MAKPTIKYKLRAECFNDVIEFYKTGKELPEGYGKLKVLSVLGSSNYPDVEVEIETDIEFDFIKDIMLPRVKDGFVMAETIATSDRYTGLRPHQTQSLLEGITQRVNSVLLDTAIKWLGPY